jgi:hypothetical protein
MDSTSSAECPFRPTVEDCNDLQNIAKLGVRFPQAGNESVHYLQSPPGIFPAQPPHLTKLGGDAVRAWCVRSAGCTSLVRRLILLEAFGARYEAGLRSRLDLPIRQMFK